MSDQQRKQIVTRRDDIITIGRASRQPAASAQEPACYETVTGGDGLFSLRYVAAARLSMQHLWSSVHAISKIQPGFVPGQRSARAEG